MLLLINMGYSPIHNFQEYLGVKLLACVMLVTSVGCVQLTSEINSIGKVRVPRILRKKMPNPQLLEKIGNNAIQIRVIHQLIALENSPVKFVKRYRRLLIELSQDIELASDHFRTVIATDKGRRQRWLPAYFHSSTRVSRIFTGWLEKVETKLDPKPNIVMPPGLPPYYVDSPYTLNNTLSKLHKLIEYEQLSQPIKQDIETMLSDIASQGKSIKYMVSKQKLWSSSSSHTVIEDSFVPVEEEIAHILAGATENIGEAIILGATLVEIKQLIAQGANVERRYGNGKTALMLAAQLGKWQNIALLLDAGAELNAQDDEGNTALHFALAVGHHETIALLIIRGASTNIANNDGITPLTLAQESGDAVSVELIQTAQQLQSGEHQSLMDTTVTAKLLQHAATHDSHVQPQIEEEQVLSD